MNTVWHEPWTDAEWEYHFRENCPVIWWTDENTGRLQVWAEPSTVVLEWDETEDVGEVPQSITIDWDDEPYEVAELCDEQLVIVATLIKRLTETSAEFRVNVL